MDFQSFVDQFESMTCIISVRTYPDGSYGDIRLVAGNAAYVASIENRSTISASQMLKNRFIPNSPYEDYIPKDLNFEDACYRCAILKKPYHTYIHPDRYSFWIDMYMLPVASEEPNVGYCTYTQELTVDESSERMSNLSASSSAAALQTCIKLKNARDFQSAIDEVLADIREICGADTCCILLTDFERCTCTLLGQSLNAASGMTPFDVHMTQEVDDFFAIASTWRETIAGSTCLIIKNQQEMDVLRERNPLWHASLTQAGVSSLVLFPLVYKGETLGYIWAVNFDTRNVVQIKETLELTSQLIASEIANDQMMNRLSVMGTVDMLTGVLNRNAMNSRVEGFVRGEGRPARYGVIFADLNGLKQTNDRDGHSAGDKLLQGAAALLTEVFPDAEIYRAGGDEFLLIAPDVPEDDLTARVEKLRRDSRAPGNISFALGLSYDGGEGDIHKAMRMADERMYSDKKRYYRRFSDRKKP